MQLVPAKRIYASDHAIYFSRIHGDRLLGCKRKSCKDQPNDRIFWYAVKLMQHTANSASKSITQLMFHIWNAASPRNISINVSVVGSKFLQCSVWDIHAAWVF